VPACGASCLSLVPQGTMSGHPFMLPVCHTRLVGGPVLTWCGQASRHMHVGTCLCLYRHVWAHTPVCVCWALRPMGRACMCGAHTGCGRARHSMVVCLCSPRVEGAQQAACGLWL
jgi:hypothetical protein